MDFERSYKILNYLFMKKLVFAICIIIGSTQYVSSQNIANHALGIRFGDNDGFGGELSYQRK